MLEQLASLIIEPWPWYVAGPIIGLVVPALLVFVGHAFGISSSFRDICAAALPGKLEFFAYDWRRAPSPAWTYGALRDRLPHY